jgi:hypothetical protein
MDRHRVVQTGLDAAMAQKRPQLFAPLGKNDIKMIDVVGIDHLRKGKQQVSEAGVVATCDGSALFCPRVQPGQLMAENQPLKPLHAVVETQSGVNVAFGLGMISQRPHPVGKHAVVGGDETGFACCAEIFRG